MMKSLVIALMALVAGIVASPGLAQQIGLPGGYPAKPVKILVGTAAGGASDILARMLAKRLTDHFGKAFVVENNAGATGMIALAQTSKADPDGYLFFVTSSSQLNNAVLVAKVPQDPRKALAPVAQFTSAPQMLFVTASLPVNTVAELIAYAKKNPEALNYGTPGVGSAPHVVGEMLTHRAGIKMTHVPFKGSGAVLPEAITGRIQVMIATATSTMPHVKAGKLKALGSTGPKRSPALPDIPAIAETLPGFNYIGWIGLVTTAGVPPPIINAVNRVVVDGLNSPEIRKSMDADGVDPAPGTPEQLRQTLEEGIAQVEKLVNEIGLKLQ